MSLLLLATRATPRGSASAMPGRTLVSLDSTLQLTCILLPRMATPEQTGSSTLAELTTKTDSLTSGPTAPALSGKVAAGAEEEDSAPLLASTSRDREVVVVPAVAPPARISAEEKGKEKKESVKRGRGRKEREEKEKMATDLSAGSEPTPPVRRVSDRPNGAKLPGLRTASQAKEADLLAPQELGLTQDTAGPRSSRAGTSRPVDVDLPQDPSLDLDLELSPERRPTSDPFSSPPREPSSI